MSIMADLETIEAIKRVKYRYLRALDTKHWDDFADTLTDLGLHARSQSLKRRLAADRLPCAVLEVVDEAAEFGQARARLGGHRQPASPRSQRCAHHGRSGAQRL